MKLFILPILLLTGITAFAQPKIVTQAIISTTTNVIAPEDEDVSQIQPGGGGGGFNFRNFGDGVTKTTTFIKGDLVKLQFAVIQFVINTLSDQEKISEISKDAGLDISAKPFVPVLPPLMIRTDMYDAMDRLEPRPTLPDGPGTPHIRYHRIYRHYNK